MLRPIQFYNALKFTKCFWPELHPRPCWQHLQAPSHWIAGCWTTEEYQPWHTDWDAGHVNHTFVCAVRESTPEVCTVYLAAEVLPDNSDTVRRMTSYGELSKEHKYQQPRNRRVFWDVMVANAQMEIPWVRGKSLACDVTVPDTLATIILDNYLNRDKSNLLFKTWRCISCLSNVASAHNVPYVATLFGEISCKQEQQFTSRLWN